MKKLFLKSNQNNNSNNNIYLNQENVKPNTNLDLNNSFLHNKNKITVEYPKISQPSSIKTPLELPKIPNKINNNINSPQFVGIKRIMISNSSSNIYSQKVFDQKSPKLMKKDKTQISLIKEEENDNNISNDNININYNTNLNNNINVISKNLNKNKDEISLFKKKFKNPNNNINNITNINIHIYSNENQTNNDIFQRNTANSNNNKKNIIVSRDIINKPLNNYQANNKNIFNRSNSTIETNTNINNNGNNIYNNNYNSLLFPRNNNFNIRIQKRKKTQKNRSGHSSSVEGNKNATLAIAGNIIMNNNKINLMNVNHRAISKENENTYRKKSNNSLPEINLTQIDAINKKFLQENQNFSVSSRNKTLNEILEEYEEINYNDFEKINNATKFLIDINNDKNNFVLFLKLFQIHLDIEKLLNCLNIHIKNNQNNQNNNEITSPLRQKIQLYISNDKQSKLFSLLNNYFNILNEIYNKKYISQIQLKPNNEQNDLCFFTFT